MKAKILTVLLVIATAGCGEATTADYCALQSESTRLIAEAIKARTNESLSVARTNQMMLTVSENATKMEKMAKSLGKHPACK
jgi:hypothetical protein